MNYSILQITITLLIHLVSSYRTSICIKDHEEFSLCGWRCPATCVNLRLVTGRGVYCPLRWECQVGCRCSAGYIRDEYSKQCIRVQDCPLTDQCPPGQVLGINLQCMTRRSSTISNETDWQDYN